MKYFKKTDLLIIAALVLISVISYAVYMAFSDSNSSVAEIYCYGELVHTVDLNRKEDQTFSIPENPNVIFHLYEDGGICFEKSDCPDKVCINTGILRKGGEFAACIPNGILLKIKSKKNDETDIIVGR